MYHTQVNKWTDQPTLELMRQLVEYSGFCFLDKDKRGDVKEVRGVDYVAAMDLPGGGKNDIPNRLKRHFFMLTVVTPSPSSQTLPVSVHSDQLAVKVLSEPM